MFNYKFELITGPMSCGKTEELLRRLRRVTIAGKKIKVFSPMVDTRVLADCIESRTGSRREARKIKRAIEILDYITTDDEVIAGAVLHDVVEDTDTTIEQVKELFGEQIAAFIVMQEGFAMNADHIRTALDGKIAKYKIPHYMFQIDVMPINASGKVLKTELRERVKKILNKE